MRTLTLDAGCIYDFHPREPVLVIDYDVEGMDLDHRLCSYREPSVTKPIQCLCYIILQSGKTLDFAGGFSSLRQLKRHARKVLIAHQQGPRRWKKPNPRRENTSSS